MHYHFQCGGCGLVFDVFGRPGSFEPLKPDGLRTEHRDIVLIGLCTGCRSPHRIDRGRKG